MFHHALSKSVFMYDISLSLSCIWLTACQTITRTVKESHKCCACTSSKWNMWWQCSAHVLSIQLRFSRMWCIAAVVSVSACTSTLIRCRSARVWVLSCAVVEIYKWVIDQRWNIVNDFVFAFDRRKSIFQTKTNIIFIFILTSDHKQPKQINF